MIEIIDQNLGFDDFLDKVDELALADVEVGYTQASGNHGEKRMVDLASLMEFGGESEISEEYRERASKKGVHFGAETTIKIPARPAMRTSFDNNTQELGDLGVKLGDRFLDDKIGSELLYEAWGDEYRNLFINGVITKKLGLKENSDFAIKIKGSDTPWVDSGRLINASEVMVNKK